MKNDSEQHELRMKNDLFVTKRQHSRAPGPLIIRALRPTHPAHT